MTKFLDKQKLLESVVLSGDHNGLAQLGALLVFFPSLAKTCACVAISNIIFVSWMGELFRYKPITLRVDAEIHPICQRLALFTLQHLASIMQMEQIEQLIWKRKQM